MGTVSSQYTKQRQEFYNNITQKTSQVCKNTVKPEANNNQVIISGGTINGDFTGVAQEVTTDATCMISSSMSNNVDQLLEALSNQDFKSDSDLFNGFQWTTSSEVTDMRQVLANNINQIMNASCSSDVAPSANNNYVYLEDTTVNGNFIGVSNKVNSKFDCILENYMKNIIYNKGHADQKQSTKTKGIMAALVGIIAAIIICGMIIFLIMIFIFIKNPEATALLLDKAADAGAKMGDTVKNLMPDEEQMQSMGQMGAMMV